MTDTTMIYSDYWVRNANGAWATLQGRRHPHMLASTGTHLPPRVLLASSALYSCEHSALVHVTPRIDPLQLVAELSALHDEPPPRATIVQESADVEGFLHARVVAVRYDGPVPYKGNRYFLNFGRFAPLPGSTITVHPTSML